MSEKPAASTMPPPPSATRIKPTPEEVTYVLDHGYGDPPPMDPRDAVTELGGLIHELGVAVLLSNKLSEEDEVADDLYHQLFMVRDRLRAVYMALPGSNRAAGRRIEETAIGPFDPSPRYDRFDEASTATLLVQSIAPINSDEVVADALEQLGGELTVFAETLGGQSRITPDILYRVATGYEQRVRVLSAIARKTLRAAAGRAA